MTSQKDDVTNDDVTEIFVPIHFKVTIVTSIFTSFFFIQIDHFLG